MLTADFENGFIKEKFVPDYANFLDRLIAVFIDFVIIAIVLFVIILIMPENEMEGFGAITIILGWLYFSLQESGREQATIGKRMMSIYVTNLRGQRISFLQATARHFCKYISGIILFIGYLMMLWDIRNQTMHDKIVSTLVLKDPATV